MYALSMIENVVFSIPGTDIGIVLNCAAHETYDWDKSRYEPYYGQLVTSDQVLKKTCSPMFTHLHTRVRPSVCPSALLAVLRPVFVNAFCFRYT